MDLARNQKLLFIHSTAPSLHCTSLQLQTVQRGPCCRTSRGLSLYSLLVCEGLILSLLAATSINFASFISGLPTTEPCHGWAQKSCSNLQLVHHQLNQPRVEANVVENEAWKNRQSALTSDGACLVRRPTHLGLKQPDKASNLHSPSGERSCSHCIRDTLSCIHFAKLRVAPD